VVYDLLETDCPIRQGDIFYPLPYTEVSLNNIQSLQKNDRAEMAVAVSNWDGLLEREEIVIITALRKTWGIIASQNCDASRIPNISLFQIEQYHTVNPTPPTNPKKWITTLTERACKNASWFYLPIDERLGIHDRMIVNFHKVFQIPRADLERNIKLRKGRLVDVAYEHYRESIAQYYRRYPYNEWYPMNREEAALYVDSGKCVSDDLYAWQK
jgi:hypothetical protein